MSNNHRPLGPYELQQPLEGDAQGEVWKAFDTQQRRYVTIKIVQLHPQTTPALIARLRQDLVSLRYPYIVQVLDVKTAQELGINSSDVYIVMEHIEGQTCADYLRATSHVGQFPQPIELVRLLGFVGAAVDYAHQQGIVHGDMKPSNIVFNIYGAAGGPPGQPKVKGFGLNTFPRVRTLALGDVAYMAPEVAQGQPATERSDLYSLGVMLYEMCTGTLPFQGDTPEEIMNQHIQTAPTPPSLINPRIPPALAAVIIRSMAKDPAARFPTASSIAVAVAKGFNMSIQDLSSQSGAMMGLMAGSWSAPLTSQSPANVSPVWGTPSNYLQTVSAPTGGGETEIPTIRTSEADYPGRGNGMRAATPNPVSQPGFAVANPISQPGFNAPNPVSQPGFNAPNPVSQPGLNMPNPVSQPGFAAANPISQPGFAPYAPTPMPPQKRQNRGLAIILIILVALIVLGSASTALYFLNPFGWPFGSGATTQVMGHAYFVSSGLLTLDSAQGIADRVQIDIPSLPAPPAGKSYYAWLLGDNGLEKPPILLGSFNKAGRASLSYPGDKQHSDLLSSYSRFLITRQPAGTPPATPSLDPQDFAYYAAFSRIANPQDAVNHYSLLDHLRHLLAQDPKVKAAGLSGGLDIWLFRNSLKILEWAGSARDARASAAPGDIPALDFSRRQLTRILQYLDGLTYVKTENLPPDLNTVLVDQNAGKIGLLTIDQQNQNPPGYLKHIGTHLRDIVVEPGVSPGQKQLAIEISQGINNVQGWMETVHDDAAKLLQMDHNQLQQPEALQIYNDLFNQANSAFTGQTDPNTNQIKAGVAQIHYDIQRLASFDIMPCTATTACG